MTGDSPSNRSPSRNEPFQVTADPERVAQLIAHRACCGVEHDPANGKLHGCCVVCGMPWPCEYAGKPPSAPSEKQPITDNDKRWRILEHGCMWVSFCPTGGEAHSFDPRYADGLQAMRAFADEISEKQLATLREAINAAKR